MERKIYFSLAMVATATAIITSLVIAFLFYDIYGNDLENIASKLLSILPATIGVLVFILIGLFLVAHILTLKIIKPISIAAKNIQSIMTGKKIDDTEVYDELKPFIKTIEKQKEEIEDYIYQLKEAEKFRRDFTANVSHELKTPLTSINGYAEMIATGQVDKENTIKFANIILKEGNRLLELIDSIINLSRIESETEGKKMEPVNIHQMAREVVSQLAIRAKSKDISLNFNIKEIAIMGNKRMIKDLLYNLIDNAIKYNKPKGIVNVFLEEKNGFCILTVEDTGIGITEDEQDKVFERFYMVDKSRSKKLGGSGLGLSIVKHIVRYHQGSISLSSKLDEGTKIVVKLPIKNSLN
ncbi:MAG: HAMP domain-containing histidine kinase [Tissierellia bacterium]|nr:HAMP domain-containing histidine kinase [Tissierellia bacterium]